MRIIWDDPKDAAVTEEAKKSIEQSANNLLIIYYQGATHGVNAKPIGGN